MTLARSHSSFGHTSPWLAALLAVSLPSEALADESQQEPQLNHPAAIARHFSNDPHPTESVLFEAPLLLPALAGLVLYYATEPAKAGSHGGDNPFDRPWAPDGEKTRTWDATLARTSDWTGIGGALAVPVLTAGLDMVALDAHEKPLQLGFYQLLVSGEAAVAGLGVALILKPLSWRCRPHAYEEPSTDYPRGRCQDLPGFEDEAESFPSGHSLPLASIAGANLVTALRTQASGGSGYAVRYASFAIAEALALTTAWLRVEAGAHSASDVLAALAIGHAVGTGVALAHPMVQASRGNESMASTPATSVGFTGNMLTLRVAF